MKELEENNFVSVIIPCRNEEKFIGKCLDSVINNDYPKDKLEVLIMDGMSEDKTREIIQQYIKKYGFIKILDNPKKITPCALNIGIKNAKGEIIIRMDAHSVYEKNYISKCVRYLNKDKCDNVGGIWKILSKEKTLISKSIAFVSSSIFGAGNAYYRIGYSKGLKWVDTVFGGCYKKEIFDKIGYFNEKLIRNQDLEFNLRLKKAGGKILLVPDIITYYYPKSNFKDFFIHNFKDGFWVIYPLKFKIKGFSWRHLIPIIFVFSLIMLSILSIFSLFFLYLFLLEIGLYFLTNIYFTTKITLDQKNLRYFFILPFIFANRHIGYGLGSIFGLINIFIQKNE